VASGDPAQQRGDKGSDGEQPGSRPVRRIELNIEVERAHDLVNRYIHHMADYRRRVHDLRYVLGRLGERLGEPEDIEE
jgi:hypothetical protein